MNGATIFGTAALIGETTNKGARDKRNDDRSAAFTGLNGGGQEVQYLVVADGVTSTHGGDQASDIAVRTLRQSLQTPSPKLLTSRMADAIHQANQAIADTATQNPELKGMSTTLVLAAIEGEKLYVMHLGDSRAYLLRGGKAHQLTLDHTWVQEALDEGRITAEQAATHPNRHVIQRYLGAPRTMSIDTRIIEPGTEASVAERRAAEALPLQPGDGLLLCSDGLYGRISSAELAAGVAAHRGQPQRATDALVNLALKRDEPDNITALLLTTGGGPAAAAAPFSKLAAIGIAAVLALLAVAAFFLLRPGSSTPAAPPPVAESTGAQGAGVEATLPVEAVQAAVAQTPQTQAAETQAAETQAESGQPAGEPASGSDGGVSAEQPPPAGETPAAAAAITTTEQVTATGAPLPTSTSTAPGATPGEAAVENAGETVTNTDSLAQDAALGNAAESVVATLEGAEATPEAAGAPLGTPTPAPARGDTPVARPPTSTPLATTTPSPTATTTPSPSPTQTRAATATPATRTPTATPEPPVPAAPVGSSAPGSAASGSAAAAVAGGPTSVVILGPPSETNTDSTTEFRWQPDAPLAAGQEYEVAFWRPGEGPDDGRGWSGATTGASISITPPDWASGSYRWGVWLRADNGSGKTDRVRYLGGGNSFDVPGSGGGDTSDNVDDKP